MFQPKISIITPVYNNEKDIANCIQSVANQTYKNIEHIIIDGNSTDNTLRIIKENKAKYDYINYISEKDKGIYDAMNKGIELATGDYLYFMGSDDEFYHDAILHEIASELEGFDVVYGNVYFKHKNIIYGFEADINKLKYNNIPHQAIFYKRTIFDELGYYGNSFVVSEDYILNIKCFKENKIIKKYINKIICNFNDTSLSNSFRDGFLKYRLFHFDNLTLKEKLMKYYFYIRPDWFIPSKFFK